MSVESGIEYKVDNDDIIHLRDFACSASLPGTLFNEMSGAYMVSRQDGSEGKCDVFTHFRLVFP